MRKTKSSGRLTNYFQRYNSSPTVGVNANKNTNDNSSSNANVQVEVPNVGLTSSTPPPAFTMEQKLLVLETWHYVKDHLCEVIIKAMHLSYYNDSL